MFSPLRPEVLAAISQSPGVQKQVRFVAEVVRKRARQKAPKETGNLQRNIDIEAVRHPRTGMVEYHVGWRKGGWYGSLVELGTEDDPAHPHLRPAADEVSNRG